MEDMQKKNVSSSSICRNKREIILSHRLECETEWRDDITDPVSDIKRIVLFRYPEYSSERFAVIDQLLQLSSYTLA